MRALVSVLCLIIGWTSAEASFRDNLVFGGYLRETPILWQNVSSLSGRKPYVFTNNLHSRQNFKSYINPSLTAAVEVKTRLFSGNDVGELSGSTQSLSTGATYFDLSHTFIDEPHAILIGTLDRVWLSGTSGPFQMTIGRQRIAWGTGLVWNPIDLFNPASPLDYDNEEKPGADAIRLEWYTGVNSQLDIGVTPRKQADEALAAVRYKTNLGNYDWMALAGRRRGEIVLGGAWAGNIHGGGFRGELLWGFPRSTEPDKEAYLTGVVDGDYTFRNSTYLHAVILFNQRGTTGNAGGERRIQAYERRELTPARVSILAEAARDITPLIRIDLIGIYNPNDHSRFIEPNLTWSVVTNLDLTLLALLFGGRPLTEFGDAGNLLMARLKYSF